MYKIFMLGNPYYDQTLFGFLVQFMKRCILLITGQLPIDQLVSDEIQVFVLSSVAISSALIGSFLVLRKMTMLANSLSHTILLGIVLAYVASNANTTHIIPMQAMVISALLVGLLTTFLTQFLTHTMRLQADASIGLVFTSLFALGVVLVTILTRNTHIGTEAIMGNADALHISDLWWVLGIVAVNLCVLLIFFKEFVITTFDPALACAMGFSPMLFNYLLMSQVSLTTVTSFRAVGVLLVLSFMTGPVLTARLLTHNLKILLLLSSTIGGLAVVFSVAFTRHVLTIYGMSLSTSGVVVCTILLFYLLVVSSSLSWQKIANQHQKPTLPSNHA